MKLRIYLRRGGGKDIKGEEIASTEGGEKKKKEKGG